MVIQALWEICSLIPSFDWISLTVANDPTITENPYLVMVQGGVGDLGTQDYVCNTDLIAIISTQGYQPWQHQSWVTCVEQPIHIHTCEQAPHWHS